MRTASLRLAVLLAVAPFRALPAEPVTTQFDQQWFDAVISIERPSDPSSKRSRERSIGTGFLVMSEKSHLVLVTAKHVVISPSGSPYPEILFRINKHKGDSALLADREIKRTAGGDWFVSDSQDLALRFLPLVPEAEVKAVPLELFATSDQILAGAPIAVLGFPLGLRSVDHADPIARHGMVARAGSAEVVADAFVFPGNSGSPVLYVPPFKVPGLGFAGMPIAHELLVGMVLSYIPYQELAISPQTGHVRVVFEENSGLATVLPAKEIRTLLQSPAVSRFDQGLSGAK